MARSLSQQDNFKVNSNYYKGYFHKLITLGTPHKGSPFGPLLYYDSVTINLYINQTTIPGPLQLFMKSLRKPIGLCHRDFDENGPVIQNNLLATLPFYTYAIGGDYEGSISDGIEYSLFSDLIYILSVGKTHADLFHISGCPNDEPSNDIIVPMYSQIGGNTFGQIFQGTAHLEIIHGETSETNSLSIQNKVVQLLLADTTTNFNKGFIKASDIIDDCDYPSVTNKIVPTKKSLNHIIPGPGGNSQAQTVQIISPIRGSVYNQNSKFNITLKFKSLNGALSTRSIFMIEDIGWFTPTDVNADSVSFSLPVNASVGSKNIALLVRDTTGVIMGDTSHIVITADGVLDSLSVNPSTISLDSLTREQGLSVHGYYTTDSATLIDNNLTDESTGTIYSAKLGGVFTILNNGLIVAKKIGIDTLLISNSGKSIAVPVIIDSNFSTATMYSNLINFPVIPDKLIGDAPFGLAASVTSGNDVNFSLVSGPATIQNGILTITGMGKITVKASDSGNIYFAAAPDVYQTFCVDPPIPSAIKGDTATCTVAQTYTISKEQNIKNEWEISSGGSIVSNDTTATITWNETGKHTITVVPFTPDSCYGASQQLVVTVTAPPIPTISSIGDTVLLSSASNYYQWYFNNDTLAGEVSRALHIDKVGFYKVATALDTTCWSASLDYPVILTTSPLSDTVKINIYPNPSNGSFNVDVKLPETTGVTTFISVYDVNGKLAYQTDKIVFFGNEIKIPITLAAKGTFFVKVYINGDTRQQTLINM